MQVLRKLPRLRSGFRLRALTPPREARVGGPEARTPAERLNFDSRLLALLARSGSG